MKNINHSPTFHLLCKKHLTPIGYRLDELNPKQIDNIKKHRCNHINYLLRHYLSKT